MRNPRILSGIVIAYATVRWFTAGGILPFAWMTDPSLFVGLSALFLVAYLTSGIALLRFKAWGARLAFATSLLDGLANAVAVTLLSDLAADSAYILLATLLAAVLPPVTIAYLAWRTGQSPNAWKAPTKSEPQYSDTALSQVDSDAIRLGKRVFWVIIAFGATLPWIVGAGVKIYLDSQGQPTHPWSTFLNVGTPIWIVPLSAWLSLSYIGFAFLARRLLSKPFWKMESLRSKMLFIGGGVAGATVGTVWVFIDVFWEFYVFVLLMPLWAYSIPTLLIGAALGYGAGRAIECFSKTS